MGKIDKMKRVNPTLEPLPIKTSCNFKVDRLFCYDILGVAVNYYVLRPQKENNS